MPLTIIVRAEGSFGRRESASAQADQSSEERPLSLSFDTPRLVIGRGESCDLRLPDPSVSLRHASIRQRGGEYVLLDEGSANGTSLGKVDLPPQSARVIRSGDLVRIGRVWLEVRVEPIAAQTSSPTAAKELALELVSRGLAAQGEDLTPRISVIEGPDSGKQLKLGDPKQRYVLGRSKDADLPLEDEGASRRHIELGRKGDLVVVRDLGSKAGATLEGMPLGTTDTPWRSGQTIAFGDNVFVFENPAAEALAEIERGPDEKLRPDEGTEMPSLEPSDGAAKDEEPASTESVNVSTMPARRPSRAQPAMEGNESGWSVTDVAVVLLALGVLVASVLGLIWLLGH